MSAFELSQLDKTPLFKIKGGRVHWESITYRNADRCIISRIVDPSKGGKPFMLGLNYISRSIDPDTEVEIVNE